MSDNDIHIEAALEYLDGSLSADLRWAKAIRRLVEDRDKYKEECKLQREAMNKVLEKQRRELFERLVVGAFPVMLASWNDTVPAERYELSSYIEKGVEAADAAIAAMRKRGGA
jgi:hypothetical protein